MHYIFRQMYYIFRHMHYILRQMHNIFRQMHYILRQMNYILRQMHFTSPVCIETRACAKAFVTFWTNMRFLSCVGPYVSFKEAGPVKCFSTHSAW